MVIPMLAVAAILAGGGVMRPGAVEASWGSGAGAALAPSAAQTPGASKNDSKPAAPPTPHTPDASKPSDAPKAPAATPGAPGDSDGPPNTLTDEERAAGWILLFDGSDASANFRGYRKASLPDGWQVIDGAIVRKGPGGDLVTREQYGSFEFLCDWKVAPGGNSGIMWHVSEERTYPWETGPEMQILDDAAHVDGRQPETSAGACYALYPAPEGAVRPAGEWNRARILVDGSKVELWLNGVRTAAFDTSSDEWKAKVAASKFSSMPQFGAFDRGHIALQDHGDEVFFRNIRIRPIE